MLAVESCFSAGVVSRYYLEIEPLSKEKSQVYIIIEINVLEH